MDGRLDGLPKGALFDHRNLGRLRTGTASLRARDRRLSPLPFAHVGYMTRPWDEIANRIATSSPLRPGVRRRRSAYGTRGGDGRPGCPHTVGPRAGAPRLETADLTRLRIAGTGASRVPPELVRAMRERLGCPVVVRYTSTETSLGTGTRPGDPDEVVATTVGRPVAGVELEPPSEPTAGRPHGEVGTVRMRSAAAMRGYVGVGACSTATPRTARSRTRTVDHDRRSRSDRLGWQPPAGRPSRPRC